MWTFFLIIFQIPHLLMNYMYDCMYLLKLHVLELMLTLEYLNNAYLYMKAPLKSSRNAYIYTQTSCFAGLIKIIKNRECFFSEIKFDQICIITCNILLYSLIFIASRYPELCLLFIEFDRLIGVFPLKYIVSEYIVALKWWFEMKK